MDIFSVIWDYTGKKCNFKCHSVTNKKQNKKTKVTKYLKMYSNYLNILSQLVVSEIFTNLCDKCTAKMTNLCVTQYFLSFNIHTYIHTYIQTHNVTNSI